MNEKEFNKKSLRRLFGNEDEYNRGFKAGQKSEREQSKEFLEKLLKGEEMLSVNGLEFIHDKIKELRGDEE